MIVWHFYPNNSVFVGKNQTSFSGKWGWWLCDEVLNFAHDRVNEFWTQLWYFSYDERRAFVSRLCYFSAREMPFVALYRFFLWRFDPEIGFIKWLQIHLSALRHQNLMNEPVPVCSAVSYCREQQGISSHTPFHLFCRTLVMCIPVSCLFTQHSDSFALQMELIYIQLLHSLSTIKLPHCPFLKQTCVLLSVKCPYRDFGRTITIILYCIFVCGFTEREWKGSCCTSYTCIEIGLYWPFYVCKVTNGYIFWD